MLTMDLEDAGFTVIPFGQGFKDMSAPTKEIYKLVFEQKIDGAVATIMALDRAIRNGNNDGSSVYDSRGLIVF